MKELDLMADLMPLLIKRSGGREISGLSAYEQCKVPHPAGNRGSSKVSRLRSDFQSFEAGAWETVSLALWHRSAARRL